MRRPFIVALVLGVMLALLAPVNAAQAAPVYFQFNGMQTGGGATVQALLGLDSSLVVPNGTFNQSSLNFSLSVQYNGAFTASGSAAPASVSGQFNSTTNVFSSLFTNQTLTIPSYSGTDNFQFFGANGQSWSFAGSGSVTPPFLNFSFSGTGTWAPVAPVPVPTAVILFGTGLVGLVGLARRKPSAV